MSTALWFGQPVEVIEYSVDPDVGQVGRVRTADGSTRLVPVYDLEGAEGVPDISTCGTCGRSWDFTAYPTPASLCPFCNGDDVAAAQHEVHPPALNVDAFAARVAAGDRCPGWCARHVDDGEGGDHPQKVRDGR